MSLISDENSGLGGYTPRHGPKPSPAQYDDDDKKKKAKQDQEEEAIMETSIGNVPFVLRAVEMHDPSSGLPHEQTPSPGFFPELNGKTESIAINASVSARAAHAVKFFTAHGWSQAQAVGITANLLRESALDPNASGDGGSAAGIAQWHPDRQRAFSAKFGKNIKGSSLDDQLAFVNSELREGSEMQAGLALAKTRTPEEAAAVVSRKYERPRDTASEAQKRSDMATQLASMSAPPAA